MSATLYDEALLKKINSWTEKAKLQVFGPTEARNRLEVLADLNDDKSIKLPFLVLSRPDGYTINNHNKRPLSYSGKVFSAEDGEDIVLSLNAIPVTLNYELNVYTRYEQEADAFMRELVFNFINYPNVTILLPYLDAGFSHTSTVRFGSDNVQVNKGSLALKSDQIFNYGIDLTINDAYLWDVRRKGSAQILLNDLTISYKAENVLDPSTIIVEDINGTKQWSQEDYLEDDNTYDE